MVNTIKDADIFTVETSMATFNQPLRSITKMPAKEIKENYELLGETIFSRDPNKLYGHMVVICMSKEEDASTLVYYSIPNRENTRRDHLSEQLREYLRRDDPDYIYVP